MAGRTSNISWDVSAVATGSRALVWNVSTATGKTTQLVWNVEVLAAFGVGTVRQLVWNVRAVVGLSRQLIWRVGGAEVRTGWLSELRVDGVYQSTLEIDRDRSEFDVEPEHEAEVAVSHYVTTLKGG